MPERNYDTTRVKGEIHFEDMASRDVLEKQYVTPMIVSAANVADVTNRRIFEAANAGAINCNDLTGGSQGQRVFIRGDGLQTMVNGAFIKTNTGANKLLVVNKVYRFTYFQTPPDGPTTPVPPFSHVWVEDE